MNPWTTLQEKNAKLLPRQSHALAHVVRQLSKRQLGKRQPDERQRPFRKIQQLTGEVLLWLVQSNIKEIAGKREKRRLISKNSNA